MDERTLLIVKPDAVERRLGGAILARLEEAGLRVARLKMVRLSPREARRFYRVHEGQPFLDDLVEYMASGPIWAVVLEGEGAILRLRERIGATDPEAAAPGTIRRLHGLDRRRNSVHGSDGAESAAEEIAFFGLDLSREGA